jgi:anti-sigma-K factor RskA
LIALQQAVTDLTSLAEGWRERYLKLYVLYEKVENSSQQERTAAQAQLLDQQNLIKSMSLSLALWQAGTAVVATLATVGWVLYFIVR